MASLLGVRESHPGRAATEEKEEAHLQHSLNF